MLSPLTWPKYNGSHGLKLVQLFLVLNNDQCWIAAPLGSSENTGEYPVFTNKNLATVFLNVFVLKNDLSRRTVPFRFFGSQIHKYFPIFKIKPILETECIESQIGWSYMYNY